MPISRNSKKNSDEMSKASENNKRNYVPNSLKVIVFEIRKNYFTKHFTKGHLILHFKLDAGQTLGYFNKSQHNDLHKKKILSKY